MIFLNAKIERVSKDIQKTKDKISEFQTRLRELEKQKTELENIEIVDAVRGMDISLADLRFDDMISAHYADSGFYFSEVPEFLDGPYRYYSTQRPVDIGTFPKTEAGPENIENYDKRIPVENGRFEAWGHLDYSAPLTEKQLEDYELRAAFDNPDLFRYPPRQLDAQLQVVGKWEAERNIPEAKRLAERQPDTGRFEMKNTSDRWPVNVRFRKIIAERERPSIAGQLEKGAKQAARDNAARPTPEKNTDKDR